jgi:hypothetical protein
MSLVHYHDSESEDDDSVATPVDKIPPGVVSSGLGIPPTKPRSQDVYNVKLKQPVVHSAPVTSLVDYEHDEDISIREDLEEMDVTESKSGDDNKENVSAEDSFEEEKEGRSAVPKKARTVSLPPPLEEKCTLEEQEEVVKKLEIKRRTGKSLNDHIQQRKDFRNPSIYEKLIHYFDLDELGTNLPKEVYDPHSWEEESFYTNLSKAQREHYEKKQKEKLQQQKAQIESKSVSVIKPQPPLLPSTSDKKRKSKWDQGGPGSSGTSPSTVGSQARINAQLQADLQKLLNKK